LAGFDGFWGLGKFGVFEVFACDLWVCWYLGVFLGICWVSQTSGILVFFSDL